MTPPVPVSGGVKRTYWLVGGMILLVVFVGLVVWLRSRGRDSVAPLVAPVAAVRKAPAPTIKTEPAPNFAPDSDGDGVSDTDEATHGTDARKGDTDGDGFNDLEEIYLRGTNPLVPDPPAKHPIYEPSATSPVTP